MIKQPTNSTNHRKKVIQIIFEIIINAILIGLLILGYQYYNEIVKQREKHQSIVKLEQSYFNTPNAQVRPFDQYLITWWTDTSDLSENRQKNVKTIKNSQLKVIYITLETLPQLLINQSPLHPAFQYLSAIQKGDYLKAYFMNFYGGGYTDLKKIQQSFVPGRDKLRNNTNLFGVGYYQQHQYDIARDPADTELDTFVKNKQNYKYFIGNGNYIFRPMTEFTQQWYNKMVALVQQKKDLLKKYPAKQSRQRPTDQYPYPIRWGQLNGYIFARLQYKYGKDRVSDGIPLVIMKDHI